MKYQPMRELPQDLKNFEAGFRLFSDDETTALLWALLVVVIVLQTLGIL